MERQTIAYAILLVLLIGVALLWRRARRVRKAPDRHLRIDLLAEAEEPVGPKS